MKKNKCYGLNISTLKFHEVLKKIQTMKKGTIYCCTLNEAMMASEDKKINKILSRGDILTPDGIPLVLGLRLKGYKKAERVYGPELLEKFLLINKIRIKCLFIGGIKNMKYFSKFGKYLVLPYKDEFEDRDYEEIVGEIKKYHAKVIWIGLGSKKQLIMADELSKRLPDRIYVAVGAAFDFLSGNKKQAPKWLRQMGGEWLFRLFSEPKRLFKRYLKIIWFLVENIGKIGVKR